LQKGDSWLVEFAEIVVIKSFGNHIDHLPVLKEQIQELLKERTW